MGEPSDGVHAPLLRALREMATGPRHPCADAADEIERLVRVGDRTLDKLVEVDGRRAGLEAIVRALAATRINKATPTDLTEARDRAKAWVEANPP